MKKIMMTAAALALLVVAADAAPRRVGHDHHVRKAPDVIEDPHHAIVTPILTQILTAVRQNAAEIGSNQFAAAPPIQGEGSSVTIRMKPTILYKDGKLEMLVYVEANYINKGDFSSSHEFDNYPMLEFARRKVETRHYTGSNAFGVAADVSVFHGTEDNLLILNRINDSAYLYHATLDGSAAKALSDATEFVVDAVLAKASNGRLAACNDKVYSATLEIPVDDFTSSCWVGARVTRLSYVNVSTGEVLRSWDEGSPAATMMEDLQPQSQDSVAAPGN